MKSKLIIDEANGYLLREYELLDIGTDKIRGWKFVSNHQEEDLYFLYIGDEFKFWKAKYPDYSNDDTIEIIENFMRENKSKLLN